MQFQLPHGFRTQCRSLLAERLPDVLDALVAAGATAPEPAMRPGQHVKPREGSAAEAPLLIRRSVFERVLWEGTSAEPAVTRVAGHADAVEVRDGRVVGVVADSALIPAELVIDAGGRRAQLSRSYRPSVHRVGCGMAYAARQYRLRPGAEPGLRTGWQPSLAELSGTSPTRDELAGLITQLNAETPVSA